MYAPASYQEYNDVLLTSFLSNMTKGLSSLNEVCMPSSRCGLLVASHCTTDALNSTSSQLVDKFEVVSSSVGRDMSPEGELGGPEKGRVLRERRGKGAGRA